MFNLLCNFTIIVCCNCIDFLGRKINLSRISPAKRSQSRPNSVYADMSRGDNVKAIFGVIGPCWAGTTPAQREFFCVVIHMTFRQLRNGWFSPNLVTKRTLVSRRGIRRDIFENFHFQCHLLPKSEIESRLNRHRTQSRLQVTGAVSSMYGEKLLLHLMCKQWDHR